MILLLGSPNKWEGESNREGPRGAGDSKNRRVSALIMWQSWLTNEYITDSKKMAKSN